MKNRDDSMPWIPLWVDKWIFGSTRIELQPDERAVWTDFMALASKDSGFIRANPETPYPAQQLAGLLCISEELLIRSVIRFIETGKIKECLINGQLSGNLVEKKIGIYYIISWGEYLLSDRHKRRFLSKVREQEQMSEKTDNMTPKADAIEENIIEENIIKTSVILTDILKDVEKPSSKIAPASRKAILEQQAKDLGVK